MLLPAVPPSALQSNAQRPFVAPPPSRPACTAETPDCEALCEGGNARACHELGDGNAADGPSRNLELALRFYHKACVAGHAQGCTTAALYYEGGEGIPSDLKQAHTYYERGCKLGDHDACENARQLGTELDRASPGLPAPAPPRDAARPKTRAELEAECRKGDWFPCLILGRKPYTGLFVGFEGAHLALTDATRQRTGLTGGWGFGVRVGLEFLHFIPMNVGFRYTWSGDDRPFSEDVVWCDRDRRNCTTNPSTERSGVDVIGATAHIETGLQHSFQFVPGLAIAPGALVGYTGIVDAFNRTIEQCVDCRDETVALDGSGPYVAGSVRVILLCLAPFFRYERYFASDFRQTFSVGLDLGLWASALIP